MPGDYVRIGVTDSGEGIAEDVKEHIFEPFFSTKGPQEGSGLGLSMVHGLVEQHGGVIEVSSKVGAGTTFEIYLPSHSEPMEEEEKFEKITPSLPKGQGTILVAEDEKSIQELTSSVLEEEGYFVINAYDGEEAIRLFDSNKEKIDLVLLDIIMPKRGGIEVYEHIRKQRAELPVLFQSGYELKGIPADLLDRQEKILLRKPYSSAELRKIVRQHLPNREE
jgi:CheY-like chemotaxis protein